MLPLMVVAGFASLFAQATPTFATAIIVETTADGISANGLCSLREAVDIANNNAAAGAIAKADCSKPSGGDPVNNDIIYLEKGLTYNLTNANGELDIGASSTSGPSFIDCTAACSTAAGQYAIIDGPGNDRALNVAFGAFGMNLVSIQGGHAPIGGGAMNIAAGASVSLTEVYFADNEATNAGGAIFNNGILTITGSIFRNNAAGGNGGAIFSGTTSTIIITDSHFDQNTAGDSGGGVAINSPNPTTITGGTMTDNDAAFNGGGLAKTGGLGVLTVTDTEFLRNSAGISGGAIENHKTMVLDNVTIQDNTAASSGGGLISFTGSSLTLDRSLIDGNEAPSGAGMIASDGTLVKRSTISNNTATNSGGGIYVGLGAGPMQVHNTTISGNFGTRIGGIDVQGELELANSTISGNSGPSVSGAGAIEVDGTLTVINSTIAQNTSPGADGIKINAGGSGDVTNTIIDNGAGANDCSGTITSGGGNLVRTNDCASMFGQSTDANNVDPKLDPTLAANGFANAYTHKLLSGSPAVDTAVISVCSAAPISNKDQRNQTRPKDGDSNGVARCDKGAYEAPPGTNPSPTASPSPTPSPTPSHSPSPTPSHSPSPTPSPTPTHSPTPTLGPTNTGGVTGTPIPTPTATPVETPTSTPIRSFTPCPTVSPTNCDVVVETSPAVTDPPTETPTSTDGVTPTATPIPTGPNGPIHGDMICEGDLETADVIQYLLYLSELPNDLDTCAFAPGEELFVGIVWGDTNCDSEITTLDALEIALFLGDLPSDFGPDCTPVGEQIDV